VEDATTVLSDLSKMIESIPKELLSVTQGGALLSLN